MPSEDAGQAEAVGRCPECGGNMRWDPAEYECVDCGYVDEDAYPGHTLDKIFGGESP